MRLKAALFPYDDLNIDEGLDRLDSAGLIRRYERGGRRLLAIPTWSKHQQPHIRESVSTLEGPDASPVLVTGKNPGSGADPDPDQGRSTSAKRAELTERFTRFWKEYPNKAAKEPALREWLKRAPDETLTLLIIAKLREHKALPQWRKNDGEFIPHARTWLHQQRWKDEQSQKANAGAKSESPEDYMERIGYCTHTPRCHDSDKCRALRAAGKQATS